VIEKVVSGIFLLFCLVYMYYAKDLSFGSIVKPKAGFLPIVAGTAGTVLALINFGKVMLKKSETSKSDIRSWKRVGLFFAGLVVYLLILEYVGYLVSTILVMFYLLKVAGTKGWLVPALMAVGVGVGFHFIFDYALGVMLP